jgi:hypothetical protein
VGTTSFENRFHLSHSQKGDQSECSNYSGITILNGIYKIVTSLINTRIMQIAEDKLGEYQ